MVRLLVQLILFSKRTKNWRILVPNIWWIYPRTTQIYCLTGAIISETHITNMYLNTTTWSFTICTVYCMFLETVPLQRLHSYGTLGTLCKFPGSGLLHAWFGTSLFSDRRRNRKYAQRPLCSMDKTKTMRKESSVKLSSWVLKTLFEMFLFNFARMLYRKKEWEKWKRKRVMRWRLKSSFNLKIYINSRCSLVVVTISLNYSI